MQLPKDTKIYDLKRERISRSEEVDLYGVKTAIQLYKKLPKAIETFAANYDVDTDEVKFTVIDDNEGFREASIILTCYTEETDEEFEERLNNMNQHKIREINESIKLLEYLGYEIIKKND